MFMESLLDRADHAERQLLQIAPGHAHAQRHAHTPVYAHTPLGHAHRGISSPAWGRAGRSLDGSVEDMLGARSPVTMATQVNPDFGFEKNLDLLQTIKMNDKNLFGFKS